MLAKPIWKVYTASMLRKFLYAALIGFVLLRVQLILARAWWFFELFTHYPHYYLILGIILFLVAIRWREWPAALGFTVFISIHLSTLQPYLRTTPPATAIPDLVVLSSNFYYENTDFDDFDAVLEKEQPDIFMIHEAGSQWNEGILNFQVDYPFTYLSKEQGIHGIAMGSRISGSFKEVPLGHKFGVEFTPDNGAYHILAVHPYAPISYENANERNLQFGDIAAYVQDSTVPVLVMGDFNSTPFTPYFSDLLKYGDLRNAAEGFGLINTWHAHSLLFQIPIDHALLHGPWKVLDFYTAMALDSDHLPIVVKLAF